MPELTYLIPSSQDFFIGFPHDRKVVIALDTKVFQLQDTSKFTRTGQNETYTSIASFMFTSAGTITELQEEYRETRKVQVSASETNLSQELLSSIIKNPFAGGADNEPPDADNDGVPDHLDITPNYHNAAYSKYSKTISGHYSAKGSGPDNSGSATGGSNSGQGTAGSTGY